MEIKLSGIITVKNLILIFFLILFGLLLMIYIGISFFFLDLNDKANRTIIKFRTNWIKSNQDRLMYIYTDIFPQAKECNEKENCEVKIRKMIDDKLAATLGYGNGEIGRLPIFFIRLEDENTIEKLYQGGKFFEEKVGTRGEKMVVQMLQGKRDPFAYPQYNCCGGGDLVAGIPIFNLFLPPRIYLKDFYTEIEHIYLMRNRENEIVGGLVYLYGD